MNFDGPIIPDALSVNGDKGMREYRLLSDDSLWGIFSPLAGFNVDTPPWFYRLANNTWQEPGYLLHNPFLNYEGFLVYNPIAIDPQGHIWVVWQSDGATAIGEYDPTADTWIWYDPDTTLCEIRTIEVDPQQRIWLQGNSCHDYYKDPAQISSAIEVYNFRDGNLHRVARYTAQNSNCPCKADHTLRLGSDGKMWLGGNRLQSIDSTQVTLPSPRPAWLTWVIANESYLICILLPGMLALHILNLRRLRRQQQTAAMKIVE